MSEEAAAPEALDTWAVVEAMGHRRLIGKVTEATIAGKAMLRVDRLDGRAQYLPPESLYMLTPCTEAEARACDAQSYSWTGLPSGIAGSITARPDDSRLTWGDDEADAIAREEAGEDWNAPGRDREDDDERYATLQAEHLAAADIGDDR